MPIKQKVLHIYDKYYKEILIIPLIIFLATIGIILFHYSQTGEFIEKGVSLKGGTTITLQLDSKSNPDTVKNGLQSKFVEDFNVNSLSSAGTQIGLIIETTAQDTKEIIKYLNQTLSVKTVTIETTGPSLGESFFKQAIVAVLIAFVFMGIVVFLYFRVFTPSIYIILSALADIIFAWAMTIVLDMHISTAGIAAFLMLIGYSVDTDILLTSRVLRREGHIFDKIVGAFSTGIVMTVAAMAATGIAYFATPSETLKQIMLILFLGLCADIWNTWITNAGLLRIYVERKKKNVEH